MNCRQTSPELAARQLAVKPLRNGFQFEALHTYTDSTGNPIYWRIRLKHPETGEKWIRPMKRVENGYALGEPDKQGGKPLYGLHQLLSRAMEPVCLVEGEWCADKLLSIGILATTTGGAESTDKAEFSPLRGRHVTIWPDNDEAGLRYAAKAANILLSLSCIVEVIDPEKLGLPPKGDVADWLTHHPDLTFELIQTFSPLSLETLGAISNPTEPDSIVNLTQNDEETVARLAALPALEYDRVREEEAKRLGTRVGTLDRQVTNARKSQTESTNGLEDIDPWPSSVTPAELLHDIVSTVKRFIVCPDYTAHTVALWCAMTWFMDVVQIAPLAVITAPEKRCGKSQLLFLLGRLVKRPLTASNITPAALFRCIDAWRPTLLVDEADAFMKDNEELRGLLNCGHTRDSAYIVRVVGDDHTPRKFNVWGAKAIAGIGHLADTLMDRAVMLELRRKLPHEQVDRLRHAEPDLFTTLASKLARFADDFSDHVRLARPDLPPSLNDRAQDNWEPLLAIADTAGEEWPILGRNAAMRISGSENLAMTVGTELLTDIQAVFDNRNLTKISTADLIAALCDDDEAPWATYNRGKPISPRQIAKRLKEYHISSKNIKLTCGAVRKGFERSQLTEAFSRYLHTSENGQYIRYPLHPSSNEASEVAETNQVAATQYQYATSNGLQKGAGSGVADKQDQNQAMYEVVKL